MLDLGRCCIKTFKKGLDTLERLQKDKQKKKFAGFWDKFQEGSSER